MPEAEQRKPPTDYIVIRPPGRWTMALAERISRAYPPISLAAGAALAKRLLAVR